MTLNYYSSRCLHVRRQARLVYTATGYDHKTSCRDCGVTLRQAVFPDPAKREMSGAVERAVMKFAVSKQAGFGVIVAWVSGDYMRVVRDHPDFADYMRREPRVDVQALHRHAAHAAALRSETLIWHKKEKGYVAKVGSEHAYIIHRRALEKQWMLTFPETEHRSFETLEEAKEYAQHCYVELRAKGRVL